MKDKIEAIEQTLIEMKEELASSNDAEILSICNNRIMFKIPSSRDGYHFVTWQNGAWECTCEDHKYRHTLCKHIEESKDLLEDFTCKVVDCEKV